MSLERSMAVTNTESRKVITRLDDVKLQLLRLRAALLPEERVTATERKLIEQGRSEIERGRYVTLAQLSMDHTLRRSERSSTRSSDA